MPKQNQEQSKQVDITIWSWMLKLLSINFLGHWLYAFLLKETEAIAPHSIDTSSVRSFLSELPAPLISEILSYLMPQDFKSALLLNQRLYKELKSSKGLDYYKLQWFNYLVAIEGENNQNKAEAILKSLTEDFQCVTNMLVGRTTIRDAAGRTFSDMSAYGYAFWSGDTRMRHMMKNYMDVETKVKAYEECKTIADKGISFTFKDETVTNSKFFDFWSLLNAYEVYLNHLEHHFGFHEPINPFELTAFNEHIDQVPEHVWQNSYKLSLKIGWEQAKVPTHIAQEYCAKNFFFPLPNFKTLHLERTVKYLKRSYMPTSLDNNLYSWEFSNIHSDLGVRQVIYKLVWSDNYQGAISVRPVLVPTDVYEKKTMRDFEAIRDLCQIRIVDDTRQTLEYLNSETQEVRLTP